MYFAPAKVASIIKWSLKRGHYIRSAVYLSVVQPQFSKQVLVI